MEKVRFNTNHAVYFKLTEEGINIWLKHIQVYSPDTKIDYIRRKEDSEGFYSEQLWEVMNIFGAHMRMGNKSPFECCEIYLETRWLTPTT